MGFFRKKSVIFTVVFLTVFLLAGLVASGKYQVVFLEKALGTALTPFEYGLSRVSQRVNKLGSFINEIVSLYQHNQALKEENINLKQNILKSEELLAENIRLRELLDYKSKATHFEFVAAQVIARDPGNWTNILMINRGSNDGLEKGMVIVNKLGLVGSISSVYSHSAKVQLIIDPRSAVGALVERPESRVAAIVEGNSVNPMHPKMVNLAMDADVLKGDKIITSGFGGVYPKGIAVGEVQDIVNDDAGFLKYAVLKMAVNFDKLEEVLVIKNSNQPLPALPNNQPTSKEAGR